MILWLISLHIIFMVAWFAALFYLPRLYVYHALASDAISIERFKLMERKLYYGIMLPSGLITTIFGLWIITQNHHYYLKAGWLHTKILLVAILWVYHFYCGYLRKQFKNDNNRHSHVFYRWLNEFPVLILIPVVILAVVKPF